MSQDWLEFTEAAVELVEHFGAPYPYTRRTTVQDPIEPWKTTVTEITSTQTLVFIATDRLGHEFLRDLKITEIPAGNEVGIMYHTNFIPQIGDTVLRDGSVHRIDNCNTWKPANVALLHVIEFAR